MNKSYDPQKILFQNWFNLLKSYEKSIKSPKDLLRLLRPIKHDIVDLWEKYNTDRRNLGKRRFDSHHEAFLYYLFFHPIKALRFLFVAKRIEERIPNFFKRITEAYPKIFVEDFGCGTGAISESLVSIFKRQKLTNTFIWHLSDQNNGFLDMAKKSLGRLVTPNFIMRSHQGKMNELLSKSKINKDENILTIDLWGYVLNELMMDPRQIGHFKKRLTDKKNTPYLIFILEPARETEARNLLTLRDDIVSLGYTPIYPCPNFKNSPCPLNAMGKDWCYSEFEDTRDRLFIAMEDMVGIKRAKITSTSFVFASKSFIEKMQIPVSTDTKVIVGYPTSKDQKSFEELLCIGDEIIRKEGKALRRYRGEVY